MRLGLRASRRRVPPARPGPGPGARPGGLRRAAGLAAAAAAASPAAASPGAPAPGGPPWSPRVPEAVRERLEAAPRVVLKGGKARLFKEGQPLVYSGAVDRVEGRAPRAGDLVVVADGNRTPVGWGMFNPDSQYRVRILQNAREFERQPDLVLDLERLLRARFASAVRARRALGFPNAETDAFRLLNSEGDRVSGLVVDVLAGHLVVQPSAAWAERHRGVVERALREAVGDAAGGEAGGGGGGPSLSWRPSRPAYQKEGVRLPRPADPAADPAAGGPELSVIRERGVKSWVDLAGGQKTGCYLDQRDNRAAVRGLAAGLDVLDLCCYSGGFAVSAALGGAASVVGVDSSAAAVALARRNAELNGVADRCAFVEADISEYMRASLAAGETFGLIVLDPPKLAPNPKVLEKAARKYKKLNKMALRLLRPGGLLLTCTCSGAMTQSGTFPTVLRKAAVEASRELRVLRTSGAGPDHAVDIFYPESEYLTAVLCQAH